MKGTEYPLKIFVCVVLCGLSLVSGASAKQRDLSVLDTWMEFELRVLVLSYQVAEVPVEASIMVRSSTGQAVSGMIEITSERWDKPVCTLVVHDSFPLQAHRCTFTVSLKPTLTLEHAVVGRFIPSEPSRYRPSMRIADLVSSRR